MGLEFFFVPMVLFMVIVAPIWIVMHYRSVNRSSRSLTDDDRESIDTMLVTVDKLNERIVSLEAILDADHPNWRQQENTRGES
jgi:phage shock protein B